LRRELGRRNSDRLIYQAFDLLYLDGFDMRPAQYVEREAALKVLFADASITWRATGVRNGKGYSLVADESPTKEHPCHSELRILQ
jgi:ATP-dependent DNA ligase